MNNIFNEYNRKARLFPALLCLFPFLLVKHFLIDPALGISLTSKLYTVVIEDVSLAAVLIYLLSQINRFVSKMLFEDKSKFPTTEMLLPSNMELSVEFKKKIKDKVKNDFDISLPDVKVEKSDIAGTKRRVQEIVSLIINKVGKGNLLFQHNIEYGFVRNLIGGSVIALFISITCIFLFDFVIVNKTAFIISIVLSVGYIIPIIFSRIILNNYSKEYARILFREYLGNN